MTDLQAFRCAKALLPFLTVKRRQAENLLALRVVKAQSAKAKVAKGRGHIGAARRPQILTDQMQCLYEKAKILNHVGRGLRSEVRFFVGCGHYLLSRQFFKPSQKLSFRRARSPGNNRVLQRLVG